jgi:hypothetical protein
MARDQVPFLVESLEASEARIRLRRELRRGWADVRSGRVVSSQRLFHLAVELGVGPGWLSETIAGAQPFGALYEQVLRQQLAGDWDDRWPLVAIEVAIPALRARLATLRRAVPVAHAFEQVESVASLAAAD